jgi:hypothetical protein
MNDTIPILVDEAPAAPAPTYRGESRSPSARVVEVASDLLRERMGDLARILSDAAALAPEDSPFHVSELRFTLHVGANGEVSILSLAKGGVTTGAGIEVALTRRPTA